ncbi:hypothetical protein WOC76_04275 [Methylocystis sp. IM3]|uniref:hypothetical protein n=1 Tax=unclassified Methylocystis TaxID=2625913 RepID=UPI0030FCC3F3
MRHLAGKFEWATTRSSRGEPVPVQTKSFAAVLLEAERQDQSERMRMMIRLAAQLGKKPHAARRPGELVAEYLAREELLKLWRSREK